MVGEPSYIRRASIAGAAVSGVIISAIALGTAIPGRHATHLATVLYGVPGSLLGMALIYAAGAARERAHERTQLGI